MLEHGILGDTPKTRVVQRYKNLNMTTTKQQHNQSNKNKRNRTTTKVKMNNNNNSIVFLCSTRYHKCFRKAENQHKNSNDNIETTNNINQNSHK